MAEQFKFSLKSRNEFVKSRARGGFEYQVSALLSALLYSRQLRSSNGFVRSIVQAMNYVAGAEAAQAVQDVFNGSVAAPSAATLSRARLYADLILMQHMRDRWAQSDEAEPPFVFLGADASPQGGSEFFMLLRDYVSQDTARQLGAGKRPDEIWEPVHTHTAPLAILGSGRSGLPQKFGALVHMVKLEVGALPSVLASFSRAVVSWTCDFGTEAKIPSVPPLPLGQLLASQISELAPYFKLRGDACGADNHVFDLSGCLLVPGLAHAYDNICKDLMKAMAHVSAWQESFKATTDLLSNDHWRSRQGSDVQEYVLPMPVFFPGSSLHASAGVFTSSSSRLGMAATSYSGETRMHLDASHQGVKLVAC